jgi:hypothetical protein
MKFHIKNFISDPSNTTNKFKQISHTNSKFLKIEKIKIKLKILTTINNKKS